MSDEFICRGECGDGWPTALRLTDGLSDAGIALAYFAIPVLMLSMLRRFHTLFPYRNLWALYSVFIVLCGGTHVATVLTYWQPWYWLEAVVKSLTAVVSLATVYVLWRTAPSILRSLENAALALEYMKSEIKEREAQSKSLSPEEQV